MSQCERCPHFCLMCVFCVLCGCFVCYVCVVVSCVTSTCLFFLSPPVNGVRPRCGRPPLPHVLAAHLHPGAARPSPGLLLVRTAPSRPLSSLLPGRTRLTPTERAPPRVLRPTCVPLSAAKASVLKCGQTCWRVVPATPPLPLTVVVVRAFCCAALQHNEHPHHPAPYVMPASNKLPSSQPS